MITKITGRHMEVTEAMRSYAEKKIARLKKFYNRLSEIEVIIDSEGQVNKVEIIIWADNHPPFVVKYSNEDAYACMDTAVAKIERQLTRHKEKSRSRKGRVSAAEAIADVIEAQAEHDDQNDQNDQDDQDDQDQ